MKQLNRTLSIAVIVLVLAQAVLMFVPFFNFGGTAYSIQDYVFAKTEEIGKYITANEAIGNYAVNDYAPILALVFLVSIVVLVFNLMSHKMMFSQISAVVWGVFATIVYLTNGILKHGNSVLYIVHLVLIILAAVLSIVRLYPWVCIRFLGQKK